VKHGHTLTDLAFAWLLSRSPVSSVIAGATTPEQIDANVQSVSWELDAEALEEINGITAS
jgi:aryl-alcohol dehydrogenase-like predicted oxidoreductase